MSRSGEEEEGAYMLRVYGVHMIGANLEIRRRRHGEPVAPSEPVIF